MQLSRIAPIKNASWWLRGHLSDSAEEGLLSQSAGHALCGLPLALLLAGELAKGLRQGCCWADLDVRSPRTTQTVVASAIHLPGCPWTSQS